MRMNVMLFMLNIIYGQSTVIDNNIAADSRYLTIGDIFRSQANPSSLIKGVAQSIGGDIVDTVQKLTHIVQEHRSNHKENEVDGGNPLGFMTTVLPDILKPGLIEKVMDNVGDLVSFGNLNVLPKGPIDRLFGNIGEMFKSDQLFNNILNVLDTSTVFDLLFNEKCVSKDQLVDIITMSIDPYIKNLIDNRTISGWSQYLSDELMNDGIPYVRATVEKHMDIDVFIPLDSKEGDIVSFTIVMPDGTVSNSSKPLSLADIESGKASITLEYPVPGKYKIWSSLNGSDSPEIEVVVPGVNIPDNEDGYITSEEMSDGIEVDVTLSNSAKMGDKVVLEITKPDGSVEIVTKLLTNEDIEEGTVRVAVLSYTDAGRYDIRTTVGGQELGKEVSFEFEGTPPPSITVPDVLDGVVDDTKNIEGIEVIVEIQPGYRVGDVVEVMVYGPNGEVVVEEHALTKEDLDAGRVSMILPQLTTGRQAIQSKIGNGDLSNAVEFDIEITLLGDFGITSAASDGYLNSDEYVSHTSHLPADHNSFVVTVDIAEGVQKGDVLAVTLDRPNGEPMEVLVTVTDANVTNGSIDVRFSDIGLDGEYSLSASYSRRSKQLKEADAETFIMDITTSGDVNGDGVEDSVPLLYIPEADDGYINRAELVDGIQASVQLLEGTELGDVASFIIKDVDGQVLEVITKVVEAADLDLGVLKLDIEDLADGEYTVEAVITDAAGNSSDITRPKVMVVDTMDPGDFDGDGSVDKQSILTIPQADDGVVNVEEEDDLAINITVPDDTIVHDIIRITITGPNGYVKVIEHSATVTEVANGLAKLYTTDLGDAGEYSVTSVFEDAAGNTSQPSDPVVFEYDNAVPGDIDGDGISDMQPTLQVIDASDHHISQVENKGGVETRILLPEEFIRSVHAGDTVSLNLDGPYSAVQEQIIQQSDLDNGYVDVLLDPLTENGHYKVKATIYDEAHQSTGSGIAVAFDYDGTVPGDSNNDGEPDIYPEIILAALIDDNYIDGLENREYIDGTVVIPPGTQEGDTMDIKIHNRETGETEIIPITVDEAPSGSRTVDHPIRLPSFALDGPYVISVEIADTAGNVSNESIPKRFGVDTTAPGDLTGDGISDIHSFLVIPEADDFYINALELSDGVNADVDIPEGTEVGDTILLTIEGDGGVETIEYQVTNADLLAGKANVPVENRIGTEGEYTISSRIYDEAGNSTVITVADPFTILVDKTPPDNGLPLHGLTIVRIEVSDGDTVVGFATNSPRADVIVTLDGTIGPEDKVQGSIDGGVTWQDMVLNDDGNWVYDVEAGTFPNNIDFKTAVVDLAGNHSTTVSQDIIFDNYVPIIDEASKSHTVEGGTTGPMNTDTTRGDTNIEYSLTVGSNLFSIDPSTGEVSFKTAPIFGADGTNEYTYSVKASTPLNNEVVEVVTVEVIEKNLAPTDIQFSEFQTYSDDAKEEGLLSRFVVQTDPITGKSIELYYSEGKTHANWYDSNHVLMEDVSPVTIEVGGLEARPNDVAIRHDGYYAIDVMYRSDIQDDSRIRNHIFLYDDNHVLQWTAIAFVEGDRSCGYGNIFFTDTDDVGVVSEKFGEIYHFKEYGILDGTTGDYKYDPIQVGGGDFESFIEAFAVGDKWAYIGYSDKDSPLVMEVFNISDGTRYGSNPQYSYGNSPRRYIGTQSYTAKKLQDQRIATLFMTGTPIETQYIICDIEGACDSPVVIDLQTQEAKFPEWEYDDDGNLVIVFVDYTDNKIYTMTVSPTGTIIKNRTTIGEPIPSGSTGHQICLTKLATGEYKMSIIISPSLDILHYIFNSTTPAYSYRHYAEQPQILNTLSIADANTQDYNLNHTLAVSDTSFPPNIVTVNSDTKVVTLLNPPYQNVPGSFTIRVTDEPGLYYDKVVEWPTYWLA